MTQASEAKKKNYYAQIVEDANLIISEYEIVHISEQKSFLEFLKQDLKINSENILEYKEANCIWFKKDNYYCLIDYNILKILSLSSEVVKEVSCRFLYYFLLHGRYIKR